MPRPFILGILLYKQGNESEDFKMDQKMFCFQCEQTMSCCACTGNAGVCGKTAPVAKLQDDLTGALVGLSRATDNCQAVNDGTWDLIIEGLFATITNVNFNETSLQELISRISKEKYRLVPDCSSCGSPAEELTTMI